LGRKPVDISVLDVVDAVEGVKPLFECQEIRGRCAVFGNRPPDWATAGVCGIHAVMLRAEQSMRRELARTSLADLAGGFGRKMPPEFPTEVRVWFEERVGRRIEAKGSSLARTGAARATGPPRRKR
jgi:DNA-binding IscR family transcriptional regulator